MSNGQEPFTQFKIVNGRHFFPFNIENYQLKSTSNVPILYGYIKKEPPSDSEAGVRSENWFVVYARDPRRLTVAKY